MSVTPTVRDLVLTVVDSYEKLYVLGVLFRSDGAMGLDSLAERTAQPPHLVQDALDELSVAGFIHREADGGHGYVRGEPGRDSSVRTLLELFDRDPLELSRLLDNAAVERARTAIHERLTSGFHARHFRHHGRR